MKVLVTGATGFIGGSIAKRLTKDGHDVVVLLKDKTNESTKYKSIVYKEDMQELIDAFIRVVKPEYWNNFKKHLSKEEIEYIEKLHAQVKKQCKSYSELSRPFR